MFLSMFSSPVGVSLRTTQTRSTVYCQRGVVCGVCRPRRSRSSLGDPEIWMVKRQSCRIRHTRCNLQWQAGNYSLSRSIEWRAITQNLLSWDWEIGDYLRVDSANDWVINSDRSSCLYETAIWCCPR
jgi:hypothetical protein